MTDRNTALRTRLAKVEAGEFDRPGVGKPKRYVDFCAAMDAAGLRESRLDLMEALRIGRASDAIRAMIAEGGK